jgi:molybdenum cofactor guanylyltransferase
MLNEIGIVLAGGKSSRMGEDKAQLGWFGQTLVQKQIKTLTPLVDQVVVSGHVLKDRFDNVGPLAALDAAIHAYPDMHYCWLLPVDMPFMDLTALSTLAQTHHQNSYFNQSWLPARFYINQTLKDYLAAAIQSTHKKSRSFYALFQACGGVSIIIDEEKLKNLNTPNEFNQALALQADGLTSLSL